MNLRTMFFATSALILAFARQPTYAATNPEFNYHCEKMLAEITNRRINPREAFDIAYGFKPFQDHLRDLGYNWFIRTFADQNWRQERVLDYFEENLRDLNEGNVYFEALQEKELDDQLTLHGAPEGSYGYDRLKRLSRINLLRILGPEKLERYPENLKSLSFRSRQIVENLSFQLSHATWRRHQKSVNNTNALPVMSSKVLLGLGFAGWAGLNTYKFNQEVLKSHGQVFFNVYPQTLTKDEVENQKRHSEYGSNFLGVRRDYAFERGWVSAFLMYPENLLQAAEQMDPPPVTSSNDEIIRRLHGFDFTLRDLETLYRVQLAHALNELKKADSDTRRSVMDALIQNNGFPSEHVIKSLIHIPLKLPQQLEFKIPLAAPAGTIVVY